MQHTNQTDIYIVVQDNQKFPSLFWVYSPGNGGSRLCQGYSSHAKAQIKADEMNNKSENE